MIFGADLLANIFLFAFFFGLLFTAASLLLGFVDSSGLHIGGHHADSVLGDGGYDAGGSDAGGGDAGGHHDAGSDGPSLLNMPTIMAFLTWFGGAGYLLRQSLGLAALLAVPLALIFGVLGAAIMFLVLARLLWPMMSKPLSSSDFSLPGTPARVVSSIRAGGVGEIVYTKGGTRFTAGARSASDEAIPRGAEVVILRYERGIAYVQDVDSILAYGSGAKDQASDEAPASDNS